MKTLLLLSASLCGLCAFGQSAYDPGTAYNKYMVAHNDRSYVQIGRYRVLGTPYLLGTNHTGTVYGKAESGTDIPLAYDTYHQRLEFKPFANSDDTKVKEPGTVDSFVLKQDSLIDADLFFVYGGLLGSKDKAYYLRLVKGDKYTLYKRYKSEMEVVSTNYVEAELRQFDLGVDYYYTKAEGKELKKLKPNAYSLRKEFSFAPNIDAYAGSDRLATEPESVLKELFAVLNASSSH